ncbi:hypothetical protein [Phenylobacterium sp.]|uniref:hypothetical protein n=1 Tax=Phenylobacterium sp. TaxID=1871053 RepID=UPI00272F92B7|nr:hypothetical protein [Phenylobacterium sp.]MDP1617827.1 hypothetical protein [Phenylobacterium sp.]MDP1987485.1 hypothetical protein [Phenylobacterium sp.]
MEFGQAFRAERENSSRTKQIAQQASDGVTAWEIMDDHHRRTSRFPSPKLRGLGPLGAAFDMVAATEGYRADLSAGMPRDEAVVKNFGPFATALLGAGAATALVPAGGAASAYVGGQLGHAGGKLMYGSYMNIKDAIATSAAPFLTPQSLYNTRASGRLPF